MKTKEKETTNPKEKIETRINKKQNVWKSRKEQTKYKKEQKKKKDQKHKKSFGSNNKL